MPGGHLVTSAALSVVAYGVMRSVPLSAGCFIGGFLIDVDHYFDYLFFEKQWRRPMPASFLRYYFESRPSLLVLPLHSWELFGTLTFLAIQFDIPLLHGYVLGAAMHLVFDILINGEHGIRNPLRFYSFAYRAVNRFSVRVLMDVKPTPRQQSVSSLFWRVRLPRK